MQYCVTVPIPATELWKLLNFLSDERDVVVFCDVNEVALGPRNWLLRSQPYD